jgi:hypothetical protein
LRHPKFLCIFDTVWTNSDKNCMNVEQQLVEKWRELPLERQQEVLDFVEFLHKKAADNASPSSNQSLLGQKLRQIRAQIVDSGVSLLSREEIEREVIDRRGGSEAREHDSHIH